VFVQQIKISPTARTAQVSGLFTIFQLTLQFVAAVRNVAMFRNTFRKDQSTIEELCEAGSWEAAEQHSCLNMTSSPTPPLAARISYSDESFWKQYLR
jgi:hypothetical protein